ncbi:MAG: hypothetical protein H2212_03645 [Ruminococcus sp.]|nr:hypothetical protein [Ruminococcus sp.]
MQEVMPYNLEHENVNYSLVEQIDKTQFLHNFIDKKYRGDCLFIVLDTCEDRPNKNLKFRDAINDNIGVINDYYGDCQFAVYERMTRLQMPEVNCGNCKYLVRHYSESDNMLGFTILGEGHCIKTSRMKSRKHEDRPYKDGCFEWNDQCRNIIKQLN